jgi:hypothetical protein
MKANPKAGFSKTQESFLESLLDAIHKNQPDQLRQRLLEVGEIFDHNHGQSELIEVAAECLYVDGVSLECREVFNQTYPPRRLQELSHAALQGTSMRELKKLKNWLLMVAEHHPSLFAEELTFFSNKPAKIRDEMWEKLLGSRLVKPAQLQEFLNSIAPDGKYFIHPNILAMAWRGPGLAIKEELNTCVAAWTLSYFSSFQQSLVKPDANIIGLFAAYVQTGQFSQFLQLLEGQPLGKVILKDKKLATAIWSRLGNSFLKFSAWEAWAADLQVKDMDGEDLIGAVCGGETKVIKQILEALSDVNQQLGPRGELLAVRAIDGFRHDNILDGYSDEQHMADLVEALESCGVDPDRTDGQGTSAWSLLDIGYRELAAAWRTRHHSAKLNAHVPNGANITKQRL